MATTMTPSKRARTHALSISLESTYNTDPTTGYSLFGAWGFDPSVLKPSTLDNPAVQTQLRGVNAKGEGLLHEPAPTFTTFLEGLGASNDSGDGDTPTANGFSKLLTVWCGIAAPRVITGDTIDTASSATAITPTTPAGFAAGDFVGLVDPTTGEFHVRYVASKAGDELTLSMALPWTPANGEIIYGCVIHEWQETMSSSAAIKALGKDAKQNILMLGAVTGMSLPEARAGEAQTADWTVNQASFNKLPFTETQVAPDAARPTCAAGGEFFIRKTGNATWFPMTYLMASLTPNQEVSADEDVNSRFGIESWSRIAQSMELGLHFKNDAAVPAGMTVTDWREFFYDGNEADNTFEVMMNYSRAGRGRTVALYFQSWRVNMPVDTQVDVDSKSLQKVVLQPIETATTPPVVISQF